MKFAYMLNARNKAKHVTDAVRSMFLQQTQRRFEILLSDQGSTDGTREVLDKLASEYNGPQNVRRLDCPHTEVGGMPGLNEHINWCMTQTDADVVLQLSADDYDLAQRLELTAQAFEQQDPSMVLTAMYYVQEDMKYLGETPWPQADGWCKVEEMYPQFIGGSTAQAWTHEFFDKIGGLDGVGSPDVVLPFLACLDKGAYYVNKRCHAYRKCFGAINTGLEGIYHALPEGSPDRLALEELIHFQVTAGHYAVLAKMEKLGLPDDRKYQAAGLLANAILDRNASWVSVRQRMSFAGIRPLSFKTKASEQFGS